MNTLFSADFHLGHGNIIKYCNRPFKDVEHMDKAIITNTNQRAGDGDVLIHIGDFCCRGNERGVPGTNKKPAYWESLLKCQVVHIFGNHDKNNGIKCGFTYSVMTIGKYTALLIHNPAKIEGLDIPYDVIICGHVHDKWATKYMDIKGRKVPAINVGVDVSRFMPIHKWELIRIIDRVI